MRKNAGLSRVAAGLAGFALLCALALPGGAAEAAGQDMAGGADAVAAQLEQLVSADIDWRWLPDIEHNQVPVQALLDGYLACTPDERAGFTGAQNADLRGYFEALYAVQGKDAAEIDALFAPPPASSQSTPASSSQSQQSSSESTSEASSGSGAAPSSGAPSQSQGASLSSAPSVPSQTDGSQPQPSMPLISNPPQTPGGSGWTALFGSSALGLILAAVLVLLVAALFVRFLVSLRRAGKPARANPSDEAKARELFGEDFDEQALPQAPAPGAGHAEDGENPPSRREQRREDKRARAEAKAEARALAAEAQADTDDDPFGAPGKAPASARPEPAAKAKPAPARELPPSPPPAEKAALAAPKRPAPAPAEKKTVIAPGGDVIVQSATSRDPDAPNAISMRSFSGQPRTGRPGKMTFRQGEPEDLDAIDE